MGSKDDFFIIVFVLAAPNSFLLFSQRNLVSRLVSGGKDCPTVVLPVQNMRNIRAIDYDPKDDRLYWIDGKGDKIMRAHTNGSSPEVVVR